MAADALPLSHLVWVQMYKPLQSVNLYVKPTSTVKDGPRAKLTSSSLEHRLRPLRMGGWELPMPQK
ncbi:hypothetical protein U9M48_038598 [Paspalum notatum var. saurae]|uniref:Uncharacterized protein n=1 Tax=Paspalum notatum var. saurae TaxID=547442 RepID=A0AAQ3XDR1_PASNO